MPRGSFLGTVFAGTEFLSHGRSLIGSHGELFHRARPMITTPSCHPAPSLVPEQRAAPARCKVSIVVPVWNEAGLIGTFLRHLRRRAPSAEIVVVDGGSTDGTRELARLWCDRLLVVERGRGRQLNAGAAAARGEVLWFLHADSQVPPSPLREIEKVLADPRLSWAATSVSRFRAPGSFIG